MKPCHKLLVLCVAFCLAITPVLPAASVAADDDKTPDLALQIGTGAFMSVLNQATKYSPDFSQSQLYKMFEDKTTSDVVAKLKTASGMLDDIAAGNYSGAAYTGVKEIVQKYVPGSSVAFSTAELTHKALTEVSQAVGKQNLDFVRSHFAKNYLARTDGVIPNSVLNQMVSDMEPYLFGASRSSITYGLCQYICDNRMDTGKLAGVCVSGPFSWSKRYEFNNADQPERALKIFLRTDIKLKRLVTMYKSMKNSQEELKRMARELEKALDFVETKSAQVLAEKQAKEELRKRNEEARRAAYQDSPTPKPVASKVSESTMKRAYAAYEQARGIHKQISQTDRDFSARVKQWNSQLRAQLDNARENKVHVHYPGTDRSFLEGTLREEMGISVPEIEVENLDFNRSKVRELEELVPRLEMTIQAARKYVEYHEMQISHYQSILGPHQSAQDLAVQWSEYVRYWGVGNGVQQTKASIIEYTLYRDLNAQKLANLQASLPMYQSLLQQYKTAVAKGEDILAKQKEEVFEPARKEVTQADREYEEATRELAEHEQQAKLEADEVIKAISGADSPDALSGIAEKLESDLETYNRLITRQSEKLQRAMAAQNKLQGVYSSRVWQNASENKDIGVNSSAASSREYQVSRMGGYRSGARSAYALSPYINDIAEANRQLRDNCRKHYAEAEKLLDGLETMPEDSYKARMREIGQLTQMAGAEMSRAAKTAHMEQIAEDAKSLLSQGAFRTRVQTAATDSLPKGQFAPLMTKDAREAYMALVNFRNDRVAPLVEKRKEHAAEPTSFFLSRVGSQNGPFQDRSIRLTSQDLDNGTVEVEITGTGGSVIAGRTKMSMWANDGSVNVTSEEDVVDGKAAMRYLARVPAVGEMVTVRYQSGAGTLTSYGEIALFLTDTTSGEVEQQIRDLYAKFARAYENRDTLGCVDLLSLDWSANDDGTTIDDIEFVLENSFTVFDEVSYTISGMRVRKDGTDTYKVTYQTAIVGRIRDQNLKHEEASRVTEIVGREDGKWKILRTEAGRFWR
ncbi:MAG: hypothetical protein ACLFOY_16030 [Desulfatibacillaceae bacterium]